MLIRADLHTHPLLNRYFLNRDPSRRHRRPPFFLPVFNYLDYPRAHEAQVKLLLSVVYVLPLPWRNALDQVKEIVEQSTREAQASSVPVRVVRTAAEVRQSAREGALALMYAVEGGHVLGGDEENVDRLADLGVRYLTLVHFVHTRIGGAAAVPFGGHRRLTEFGRRVVRRLYRRGIVADLSHTTEPTFWDAIQEAAGPVIASHSGARAYALRDRNLTADQAKAIAQTGGLIGVIFCPFYLRAWRIRGSLDDLMRNICYFADLIGPGHVALGSDLDGGLWPPSEIRDIRDYDLLLEALSRAGFGASDIESIMGENLVRLFETVDSQMEGAITRKAGPFPGKTMRRDQT
jgi:membrane dipeptidase